MCESRSRLTSPSSCPRSASPAFSAGRHDVGPQSKRDSPPDVSRRYAPTVRAAPAWNRSIGCFRRDQVTDCYLVCAAAGIESGRQIRDQVVDRLDPDREADQVSRCGERGVGGRGVCHPGRVLDQALDAAERFGELEELRPRHELDRRLLRLGEERDHPAEVAHLALRDLVAGMRGQTRVEHLLDARLFRQPAGDHAGVLAVLAHSQR